MGGFIAPIAARVDLSLTTYQQKFRNNKFVTDLLFPRVPVDLENAVYPIWGRENQMFDGQGLRQYGDPAQEIRMSYSTDNYHCRDHSRKVKLPLERKAILETFGMGAIAQARTQFLQDKIIMEKEYNACAFCTSVSYITNYKTLSGGDQWSDPLNSNPIGDVYVAKRVIRKAGIDANYMIVGEDVLHSLKLHSMVRDAFKYTAPGAITLQQLASLFEIENVILASAIYMSVDGTTITPMWNPQDCLICYVKPATDIEDLSFAKTFVWSGAPATIGGYAVETWMDPDLSARTEWIANHMYYDQKITCVSAAYLLKSASATHSLT